MHEAVNAKLPSASKDIVNAMRLGSLVLNTVNVINVVTARMDRTLQVSLTRQQGALLCWKSLCNL